MDLKVVMTDPNKLAFSAPLLAEGNKGNSGTGVFEPPTLSLPLDIHGGAGRAAGSGDQGRDAGQDDVWRASPPMAPRAM